MMFRILMLPALPQGGLGIAAQEMAASRPKFAANDLPVGSTLYDHSAGCGRAAASISLCKRFTSSACGLEKRASSR